MKQPKEVFTIETDKSMVTTKFTIHDDNLAKVFKILRSNLYSNKILAVIREYSTNGYDANVDNGCGDKPLTITIPTAFEPTLQIRDNGKGLSEHDIRNIFSSYGASTKENTNDQVGTLGMGSKSGFAYADSFTITSYHGGLKTVYQAYIDETEVGAISKMHEEPSSEPTGIEITIAVNNKDLREFQNVANEFYLWFTPMPKFLGHPVHDTIKTKRDGFNIILESESCTLYTEQYNYYSTNTNENLFVKMGNIVYPVLNKTNIDCSWLNTNRMRLVLNVGIGDVSFTASRESLEMTEQTLKKIQDKLASIRAEIASTYQTEIDACLTPWQTMCYYSTLDSLPKAILSNNLVWKGQRLSTQLPNIFSYCVYAEYKKQWQATSVAYNEKHGATAIIINDGGFSAWQTKERLMSARANLIAAGFTSIYYAKGNIADADLLLKDKDLTGLKMLTLSSMAPIVRVNKATKMAEKVFKWKGTTSYPYSSNWESVTPKGKKVYVHINAYQPVGVAFDAIQRLRRDLLNVGINDFELYGVKAGQAIESDWVTLSDYIKEVTDVFFSDATFIQSIKESKLYSEFYTYGFSRKLYYSDINWSNIQCPIAKAVMAHSKDAGNAYGNKLKLINDFACNYCDVLGNDSSRAKKKAMDDKNAIECNAFRVIGDKFEKMYPLVSYISGSPKGEWVAEYINAMYSQSLQSKTPIFSSCQNLSV